VTLEHMQSLVAGAQEGSYTRAAQRLFVTQSPLRSRRCPEDLPT
jgi:DNA-binding transcriptional LysR family regulator